MRTHQEQRKDNKHGMIAIFLGIFILAIVAILNHISDEKHNNSIIRDSSIIYSTDVFRVIDTNRLHRDSVK